MRVAGKVQTYGKDVLHAREYADPVDKYRTYKNPFGTRVRRN